MRHLRQSSIAPASTRAPNCAIGIQFIFTILKRIKKNYKHFRRIFSLAFQWCRKFSRYFPCSLSKSTKHVISQKVLIFFLPSRTKAEHFFTYNRIFSNSQRRKHFVRKNCLTGTCRKSFQS